MSKISEQDALDQMHTLSLLGESEAALQEVRGYGAYDESSPRPQQMDGAVPPGEGL
jgi:hypothetical protein